MISEQIFRAYDIRGIYGVDLDEEAANQIGRSLATYINGEGKELIVGRDVRLSSQSMKDSLIDGLLCGGCDVEDIGIVTTPLLYFAAVHYKKDAGVMITASHNPPEWNGLKIWNKDHFICKGMGMEELKEIAIHKQFKHATRGKLRVNPQALSDYENFLLKRVDIKRRMTVALDPGNGSCSFMIPQLFQSAGIDVIAINADPDGTFPAHLPEPTEETLRDLQEIVVKNKADFGVGFDGDGDRVVFIDDKGRIVPGELALILLVEHYLSMQKGAPIVYEVSCSMSVEETIRAFGGKPILSRVGHTYIVDLILREGAVLGGESSGHFYFSDLYGFDDAIYASLKMAEILSEKGKLSEIADSIPKYPRININYDCPDEKKFKVVESLTEEFKEEGYEVITMDGVKVIKLEGWFLIRPSNTQPQIRLTVEAKTEESLKQLTQFVEKRTLEKIQSLKT